VGICFGALNGDLCHSTYADPRLSLRLGRIIGHQRDAAEVSARGVRWQRTPCANWLTLVLHAVRRSKKCNIANWIACCEHVNLHRVQGKRCGPGVRLRKHQQKRAMAPSWTMRPQTRLLARPHHSRFSTRGAPAFPQTYVLDERESSVRRKSVKYLTTAELFPIVGKSSVAVLRSTVCCT
jgi:hypothetical protein